MTDLSRARRERIERARAEAAAARLEAIDMGDFDRFGRDEHWAWFERLRQEAPVHYCGESLFGSYWSVTRFNDIVSVDSDFASFSSCATRGGVTIVDVDPGFPLHMFIAADPPEHPPQRRTVTPPLAPARLSELEHIVRARAQAILDAAPKQTAFDWVSQVAVELTSQMLATVMGVPLEDRHRLIHWSNCAVIPGYVATEEARRAELTECLAYFYNLRRRDGVDDNSFLACLSNGPATRDMGDAQFLGNLILLITGGNDTTRNTLSGAMYAFTLFPDEWSKVLRDVDLSASAASEIIRWQTPLAHMRRTAVRDVELGGHVIRAGDKVVMWYISGNRDEAAIEQGDSLVIDRPRVRHHLSFGFGIHRCLGNRLAEMQVRIVLEELARRKLRMTVTEEPRRVPSSFIHGYEAVSVILDSA